jgi:hypothetical protein
MSSLARRRLLGLGATLAVTPPVLVAAPAFAATGPMMVLWKNRGCACCTAWARHFQDAGFSVTMHEVDDLAPARSAAGVPADLAGCHTAQVEGYVVEGHVPLPDVQRLLAERPAILGLAVPGMPVGSPGMEVPGMAGDAYDVVAFAADGGRQVFRSIVPG